MSHASTSSERRELELALRRELESLGEPPLGEAELALVLERRFDDDPEVATVSRLVELASASAPSEGLSELELHRGWRTVEQRVARPAVVRAPAVGRRRLSVAVGGLAAAAAVLLIVIGPGKDDGEATHAQAPTAQQVAAIGEQVHASLRALDDGKTDSERAVELAADYQRRLAARQEQDG